MPSVTELVNTYKNQVFKGNLSGQEAAEILIALSALLGNINQEIRERQQKYIQALRELLEMESTVAKAKIISMATPEWLMLQESKDQKEVTLELVRSLKYFIRSLKDEIEMSHNL